jgi:hypothetical protein
VRKTPSRAAPFTQVTKAITIDESATALEAVELALEI